MLAVNLKSVFLVTQAVLPGMRAAKWGRISVNDGPNREETSFTIPPPLTKEASNAFKLLSYA